MKLLFLTISHCEQIEEQGIYTDLLRQFQQDGHDIYIVSASEKRFNKRTSYTVINGVHYLTVKTGNITQNNRFEKGLSMLTLETAFIKAIRKYWGDVQFDGILYATPPITFEKVIRYLKKQHDAKTYLMLKDIFPQNAVDLGLLRQNSLVYRYFKQKEYKLYALSDKIGCMSNANVQYLQLHYPSIPVHNLEICPNSIELIADNQHELDLTNIRSSYNIPLNKTVFLYGGNLGKPQGIPFLLQCLQAQLNNEEAYFLIVGSGTEYASLQSFFEKEQPKNMQLIREMPQKSYEQLVKACDVGMIFLDYRFTIPNFPSRLLTYMAASLPVLAATDAATDIGHVIEEGDFGLKCLSCDVEAFNESVAQLLNKEQRLQMGKNARAYVEQHYDAKIVYNTIRTHFAN